MDPRRQMHPRRDMEALLEEAPPGTEPRAPWPAADPRKQVNLEQTFFEDGVTVHFDRLPPMQSWSRWLLNRQDAQRTNKIVTTVVRFAMAGHTKLRQEEVDAIADCAARNYNKVAWAGPVSFAIAGGSAYISRGEYRFPLYTPSSTWFNPQVYFSARFPILRGVPAMVAWHGLRLVAYHVAVLVPTMFFFDSYAKTSMAATISMDPRLSRLQKSIMKNIQQRPRAPGRAPQPHAPQQQIDPSDVQRRDESYRRVGLPPPPPGRPPYPPPVAKPAEERYSQDAQGPAEWGVSAAEPEPAPRQQPGGLFGRWGSSPAAGRAPAPAAQQPPKQPEASSLWDDDDDVLGDDDADGSPVSAAARRAERAQQQAAADGSSAWDRVRQQAKANASPFARGDRSADDTVWGRLRQDTAPTERDRERTPPSQSYTYNDSDATKDPARAQAQKEFDALLEAERKGEGNSGRRW